MEICGQFHFAAKQTKNAYQTILLSKFYWFPSEVPYKTCIIWLVVCCIMLNKKCLLSKILCLAALWNWPQGHSWNVTIICQCLLFSRLFLPCHLERHTKHSPCGYIFVELLWQWHHFLMGWVLFLLEEKSLWVYSTKLNYNLTFNHSCQIYVYFSENNKFHI